MPLSSQLELLAEGVTDADIATLRARLAARGWQTRKQLVEGLGWSERKVRAVAELLGDDIVRGQRGFKLTEHLTAEDFPAGVEAARIAMAQGKKQFHYGLRLLRRLHQQLPTLVPERL